MAWTNIHYMCTVETFFKPAESVIATQDHFMLTSSYVIVVKWAVPCDFWYCGSIKDT